MFVTKFYAINYRATIELCSFVPTGTGYCNNLILYFFHAIPKRGKTARKLLLAASLREALTLLIKVSLLHVKDQLPS